MKLSLSLLAGALFATMPAFAQAPIPVGHLMDNSGATGRRSSVRSRCCGHAELGEPDAPRCRGPTSCRLWL